MSDSGLMRSSLARLLSGPKGIEVRTLRHQADLAGERVRHEFGPVAVEMMKQLERQFRAMSDGGKAAAPWRDFFCSLRDLQTSSAIANKRHVERLVGLLLSYLPDSGICTGRSRALVELQLSTITTILQTSIAENEIQVLYQELSSGWQVLSEIDGIVVH